MNWYDENIESEIRELVKILRNNGFNTTSSCGHKMEIEGDIFIDYDLKKMNDLLFNYFYERNCIPNYEIIFSVKVQNGIILNNIFYIKLFKF